MTEFFYVAEAGEFVNRFISEELDRDNKTGDYFLMFSKHPKTDATGENFYNVALYKQVVGGFVRGEDELEIVKKFTKKTAQRRKRQKVQILNCDDVNEAMQNKNK